MALWNSLNLWECFRISITILSVHFSYLQYVLRNRKPISSLTIFCHSISVFLANVGKIELRSAFENLKKIALLSKLVWQVFISDQSATALMKAHKNSTHVCLSRILVTSRQACTFRQSYSYSSLVFGLAGSPKYSVTRKNISRYYTLSPPIRYMYCLGDQKFWISCVVWGSEILYPLLWCVGDQKFWITCVVWGFRNSVSSPLVCGGTEILKLLCCLKDQKFWIISCVV